MRGFGIVLAKECRDNLRDRRTIVTSFSLALLGPVLFTALMSFVLTSTLGESREPFELTVVGAEHAPQLVAHLRRHNVTLDLRDLEDPRGAVREGREDLVLVIDEDYPERLRAGQVASVSLVHDSSQAGSARRDYVEAQQMILQYGQKLGVLRLHLRGVDPTVLTPLRITEVDTASPSARALTILGMLPYLLVLVVFMGGFYLAIDATAGEREHGSLEPLLSQPIARSALVLGKIAAAAVFSLISTVLFLASLAVSVPFVPLHRIGMSLSIDLGTCLAIFGVSLPLMLFGAALLTVVACFARTYKEAQTYLTIVVMVPTLPLVVTQLLDYQASAPLMLVPSLSQATLITDLIKGEGVVWAHLGISVASTMALAALAAWLAVAMYRRERMLV